ncbi:hypothetical protein [Halomonas llamarensis]|uniref:hypothetical protein n=1 Tax=Halomonas llamarensis TaxID=2945104 RepID=UPI00202195C9|nr:hypothetical protein [Halomonas llamarensis]
MGFQALKLIFAPRVSIFSIAAGNVNQPLFSTPLEVLPECYDEAESGTESQKRCAQESIGILLVAHSLSTTADHTLVHNHASSALVVCHPFYTLNPASFIAAVVAPLLSALRLHGGCVEAI